MSTGVSVVRGQYKYMPADEEVQIRGEGTDVSVVVRQYMPAD